MEKRITPADFGSDTPPPRIIGTECEYLLQGGGGLWWDIVSPKNIHNIGLGSKYEFTSNGSRTYIDLGKLIEYATPESLGPLDATVSDFAGVEVMRRLVMTSCVDYEGLYRQTGSFAQEKHNRRDKSTTRGFHENYLAPAEATETEFFQKLLPSFLASKVFDGQGALTPKGYALKQKVWDCGGDPVTNTYHRQTTAGNKPMVMVRNDETAQGDWRRVELRCVDGGLSPEARVVALGATSLVLRLFEHPRFVKQSDLEEFASLVSPADAAKIFAKDLDFNSRIASTDTQKNVTATSIQECFLDACESMSKEVELPKDEQYALDKWREITDRMKQAKIREGYAAGLRGICDNVALFTKFQKHYPEEEWTPKNLEGLRVTQNWDKILPVGSAVKWWKNHGSPLLKSEAIKARLFEPPQTRAQRRSEKISDPAVEYVNWSGFAENGDRSHESGSFGDVY
ncbi:MAG: proteasome accessory factor PafA2 family protein [Candidatus Saccharibacteria bacterium]|nr:proteasome accessory factor PafA2 family protein [Candidatus Saccharibacteria bacterium]